MDGQEEKILKSPTSMEDMNTQEQKQILTEPRSIPSPLKQQTSVLIQKITHLPSVLMRLVSRPDNTLEQQAEIERLVDQLVQDAQGVLDNNQVDSYLDSKNSSDFLNGVLNNSSTDESASSMDKFMSGSLDFITEPQLGISIFMEEDNFTEEQFMSYFDLDMPNYNATVQSGALKEEVSEEKVVAEYEEEQEVDALPPGTYDLIELDSMEILAEHTHFCDVCGKGFKRDANLRMHMRGHGDEYKTAAALSKPRVQQELDEQQKRRSKRYSCPFMGCKRHKLHPKFTPLKTVLCVKNHYRRSHCPKMLTCSKCRSKKFSVVADLRTHEKHCGQEKWMCSCGTSFTRKDKLLGHISLFFGHRPLVSSPGDQKTVSKQPIVVPVCVEEPVFLDQNWSGSRVVFTTQQ